ncbi:DegT/DnrJ/EryC1/StrS family aminotransferase [Nitrosovibrio sp. Nv4]|uniref:DegT/DnrJ/EryC1/StrS family aminotransferase n=1 Tax=Nitrosovibrio sp. Nv4 TaxID=1945880 RepID=UPI000BD9DC19|nr:DegT/DnrJ/EryC1/StrS family aminotransferase [Nitrosovibrio sp. Nv4]SOD41917.1 dTDP-4-amino-4,6-dideoxygalactose transaminase [Nitrosovibrio sp. Nv4]
MINVAKPYLPPFEEYSRYLAGIWSRGWLTNHGPLVIELENQLKEYLGVNYVCYVSSGSVALQIALRSLDAYGEIITTPFSYVSAVNVILWASCKPVFVDIEEKNFGLDASRIEAAITNKTSAILATHIYGHPCNVSRIQYIAQKYGLKVIYDGAQAFGVNLRNQSVFNYGDISTVSFHATKIFHTVEGGAIFTNDARLAQKCVLLRAFGLDDDRPHEAGINGKNSEFHAAMGLCNLPKVADFIQKRKEIDFIYRSLLQNLSVQFLNLSPEVAYNYAYFPLVFASEERMLSVKDALLDEGIHARRYFYPSLNKLPYYSSAHCPVAEDISKRVLCLPFYYELSTEDAQRIAGIVVKTINSRHN